MKKEKVSTREKILNVSHELFHKQGYQATGINQIIKEANIAKASLYYHFATKEDLCIAYLQEKHKSWTESFQEFLKEKDHKILAAFDFIVEDNLKNDFRGCSFLNMLSEIDSNQKNILEILQFHKQEVQNFFTNQLDNNETDTAYLLYCLFENAIIESQLFRSNEPVSRIKKIAESVLNNL